MLTWIRKILAPPVFAGDEGKTRSAALLNTLSWMLVALLLIISIFGLLQLLGLFAVLGSASSPFIFLAAASVLVVLCVIVQRLMRRGHVRPASVILITVFWLLLAAIVILNRQWSTRAGPWWPCHPGAGGWPSSGLAGRGRRGRPEHRVWNDTAPR